MYIWRINSLRNLQVRNLRQMLTDKQKFIEEMRRKTKLMAINILQMCDSFSDKKKSLRIIAYQLGRSASSVAANYRAACRARSNKEFYSKMSVTTEEADETVFWLEVLKEGNFEINRKLVLNLLIDANEIMKIVATARKNTSH